MPTWSASIGLVSYPPSNVASSLVTTCDVISTLRISLENPQKTLAYLSAYGFGVQRLEKTDNGNFLALFFRLLAQPPRESLSDPHQSFGLLVHVLQQTLIRVSYQGVYLAPDLSPLGLIRSSMGCSKESNTVSAVSDRDLVALSSLLGS